MKKMKQILLFSLFVGGAVLMSKCQDDTYLEEFSKEETLKKVILDTTLSKKTEKQKKIKYRGFEVDHRFNSTEDELKEKHTKKYLKKLYNKLRKKKKANKSSAYKTIDSLDLPSKEAIFEAAKVVVHNLPYEKLNGLTINYFDSNSTTNIAMIQNDFIGFTESDINANNQIIDEYYSQNLDYLVLEEIANNPNLYNHLNTTNKSEFEIAACTIALTTPSYGFVRSIIAYSIAGPKAKSESLAQYPIIGSSNTREDAFRHIYWNALLAQNYFTLVSKSKRANFALYVSDLRESICGPSNNIDSKEMDLHNNKVGTEIWLSKASFVKVWGINVAIKRPSTTELINAILDRVKLRSCYIVKEHPTNPSFNYSDQEVVNEIATKPTHYAVYFERTIAPKYPAVIVTNDYSNCIGSQDPNGLINIDKNTGAGVAPDDPCIRKIYNTIYVHTCYVSKDPNLNPDLLL
ncbi:hypothetical protein K8354_14965 [Polaribacter litorisediminis]|uniref:DUF6973 domain-containing protein n=1 Tax=Polaribacter litorisediminis TaxID=1908341 RepID=UPI001CBC0092|nr:hypothetical protein [Polaribacter litorisediminis]UAM97591.1 hypothetical protein K8354_14965 [Polaribacter litorisediminis]